MYMNGRNISFTDRSTPSVNSYLNAVNKTHPLSPEEEVTIATRSRQGSQQAREQLISANLRFVVHIAKKYCSSHAAFEDLIQAGNEGLVMAADRFDPSRGVRFLTFASWYIENKVRDLAYDYMNHNLTSFDSPVHEDGDKAATLIDLFSSKAFLSPDWQLHYDDALARLKQKVNHRMYGLGKLVDDLIQMIQRGYTILDFTMKHHLSDTQMKSFLTILREEASYPSLAAA